MSHAVGGDREHDHGLAYVGGFGLFMFAVARVLIGFVFLWAFLDKLFGLGKPTKKAEAWINGGSPTKDFLSSLHGTFADQFREVAGKAWADWPYMIGQAALGVALIFGIAMYIAAIAGTLLLIGVWLTQLPIESNPFLDEHLIYASVIIGIAASGAGLRYGLAPWWRRFMPRVLW